jgi:hypothetical protein
VKAVCELPGGLELRAVAHERSERLPPGGYPTERLARGLTLAADGEDLREEGVGFGVPILKRGPRTVFPGAVTIAVSTEGPEWRITALFRMDLLERLRTRRSKQLRSRPLYAGKDLLAALHRRAPALRGALTATSHAARRAFGLTTTYERVAAVALVPVRFTAHPERSSLEVSVDLSDVRDGVSEIVLMNELGAGVFDRYSDSSGTLLRGDAIGSWDEVGAASARFESTSRRVAFALDASPDPGAPAVRLFRGREHVGTRLAWAGFGYSLRPGPGAFTYRVRFDRGALAP